MSDSVPAFWPMHKIFYYKSMLSITTSAISSVDELSDKLRLLSQPAYEDSVNDDQILNPVQNIIQQGAALSRYFFPVKQKEPYTARAGLLRREFDIKEDNPLRFRNLRNKIEHFDEILDDYLANGIVGHIFPQFVGSLTDEREIPFHVFRAFDPYTATVEILGEQFPIAPIVAEIGRIHALLHEE